MTNTFLRKTLGFCLAALFAFACNKELNDFNGSGPEPNSTTSFYGRITDESGAGIPDVSVQIGNKTALTDVNGVYRISKVRVNARRSLANFQKTGFTAVQKTCLSRPGSLNRLDAMLLPQAPVQLFLSSVGGKFNFDQGVAFVEFQPNTFSLDGQPYNGLVQARVLVLRPDRAQRLQLAMPGDLRGTRRDGSEALLKTYGMLSVELSTPRGDALQIAEGQTARIGIKKTAAALPDTLPMWHFNITEGLWQEEGISQVEGEYLTATVGHFSWWNWDYPVLPIIVAGNLVHVNGLPFDYAEVRMRFQDDPDPFIRYMSVPDSSGRFLCMAPKDKAFYMSFLVPDSLGHCTNPSNTVLYGPFDTDTDLGKIQVDYSPNDFTLWRLRGQFLDCDDQPVSGGYAILEPHGRVFPLDKNGFLDQTLYTCNNAWDPMYGLHLFVVDQANNKISNIIIPDTCVGVVDLSTQRVCTPNDNFISIQVENEPEVILIPPNAPFPGFFDTLSTAASSGTQSITFAFDYFDINLSNISMDYFKYVNGSRIYESEYGIEVNLISDPWKPGQYFAGTFKGEIFSQTEQVNVRGSFRIKTE